MKKVLIIILLSLCWGVNAQNYFHANITEIEDWVTYSYCTPEYDGVVIEKELGCEDWYWSVTTMDGQEIIHAINELDEITITPTPSSWYVVVYRSYCGISEREFYVSFSEFQAVEPFTQDYVWKRTGESIMLSAGGNGYQCQWSTGSTNSSITVTEPDTYWVRVYNDCGELYDTIRVQDNAEITLATCDLSSNLNVVTWPTNPAQAAYISQVIIKRDGIQVGTAPYEDGQFIDNIGSDAASRTYTIIGVMPNGEQCPIESYPKETIHMSYLLGVGSTIDLTWNTPTGYDLMGYNICEWNPNGKDGELTVIDYVGAGVTSYTCFESQFNNGNIVVQGVEEGKTESRLLSNRSWETVGLDEIEGKARRFEMYPNPTNGPVTIKSSGLDSQQEFNVTIYNSMGQIIASGITENGVFTTEKLSSGIYIVNFGGNVQKLVVE